MQTVTYFEVGDDYGVDGRGGYEVIARFSNQSVADKYAISRGNYGNNAHVKPITICICDSEREMIEYNIKQQQLKVLNKLTTEEKAVLQAYFTNQKV